MPDRMRPTVDCARRLTLRGLIGEDADYAGADPEIAVGEPALDSRSARAGDVFFALAGAKADGLAYARDAIGRGAVAVVAEAERPAWLDPAISYVRVGNARRAVAVAAARAFPRQPETIAAVTGTSGKTSVAAFTRQLWQGLGHASASLGTLGVVAPSGAVYGALTTPDPIELHRTLHALAVEGVTHLCLEASSHGLDQHRLDGVRLKAGGFTNLSRDHLDYHPTMEAYLDAKMRLFRDLVPRGGGAAVWVDTVEGSHVAQVAAEHELNVLGIGAAGAGIALLARTDEGLGQRVEVEVGGVRHALKLPLVGAFQASNALVAAGLAMLTGASAREVLPRLEALTGVPGRLELVGTKNGAGVFVDYAHKPDALANALDALRPYASGRLIVVFGCGGDRDRGKRPIMGTIAAEKADIVIITDDNPRGEDPATIRAAILASAPDATEIGDRAEAIAAAVTMAGPGDVVLIAGKGHETGQIIGDRTLPFSDRDVAVELFGR
ncbi:UDP-N-acetylmuramoyl-L-alanyl-D-glutamate--2,6-diaminopimelate ligase [Ancylobacter dichloromethanicus]|uniref:UDP-N-acetylmuramoyl-L-alanyl-D-glutamate--2,6-diaminopimelate ligase n=1 Tax=Ancylobacter dichloromethanicus TaxID=518825 RepID=A0A9W6J470_9HYPH|nr:UDP-N-acetylmuramoyl-L-alanyl-D-glutamate--2,6-diaminopimelate ligase [Ancylobacter dichloromethanicus]MBS7555217.1 UDP-N-acetylmuramoyl-L-alanyl-D-glutamate--2,6-diaminopimelate ligase [Ancylobacter dichloromethanicus]GLK70397.1 UDP-N-acetylmuramoyl-L-alanyl-D-glutamate--2,6-diaminopimelate ligase [Ancylobacter dichloromethanicus]